MLMLLCGLAGVLLQDWSPRGAWYDEYVALVKRGHLRMAALENRGQATIAHWTAYARALRHCAKAGVTYCEPAGVSADTGVGVAIPV